MRGQEFILVGMLIGALGAAGCAGDDAGDASPTPTTGGAAGSSAGPGGAGIAGAAGAGGPAGSGGSKAGQGGSGAAGQGGAGVSGSGQGGAPIAGAGGAAQGGGGGGNGGSGNAGSGGQTAGQGGGGQAGQGEGGMGGAGAGGGGPGCGDQIAQGQESCDGADLRDQTCQLVLGMVASGTLQCTASCTFDTSACTTCSDGLTNNKETDVDCGGGTCATCAVGQACLQGADCESGGCDGGTCAAASCSDGKKNGSETDKDCGGPGSCPRCKSGQACNAGVDCASGACESMVCATKVVFQTKTVPVGEGPRRLVTADLDGDSHADILVTGGGADAVSVLLGDGKGGFAVTSFPTGKSPAGLALGDVNQDGKLDVVVASQGGLGVSVHLGHGDGTFADPTLIPLDKQAPLAVLLVDLDGDGSLDLVVASQSADPAVPDGVATFAGDGAGAFVARQSFPFPDKVTVGGLAAADLDGDGKVDLIAGTRSEDQARVLLNKGDGSFGGFTFFSPCVVPSAFGIADLDGDGSLDVVSACVGTLGVGVMLNDGMGNLAPPLGNPFPLAARTVAALVVDLDGDGHLDIAAVNDETATVSLLVGNGKGTFVLPPGSPFPAGGPGPGDIATGDFNEDGKPDLATSSAGGAVVAIHLNQSP